MKKEKVKKTDFDWKLFYLLKNAFNSKELSFEFLKKHQAYFQSEDWYFCNFPESFGKFSIRLEKTASTLCRAKLTLTDFGRGSFDILEIIQDIENEKNHTTYSKAWDMSNLGHALYKLRDMIDMSEEELKEAGTVVNTSEEVKPPAEPHKEVYFQKAIQDKSWNQKNQKIFRTLSNGFFRECSSEEQKFGEKIFGAGLNSYLQEDPETLEKKRVYRLLLAERDRNGIPYGSFRFNRAADTGVKGLVRPNAIRVLFGSHLMDPLFELSKPIIFAEGHTDTGVNNAKRLQTITSGSATTAIGKNLKDLKGLTLHFYPDLDEAGILGVTRKLYELWLFNSSIEIEDRIKVKVFTWATSFSDNGKLINLANVESDQYKLISDLNEKNQTEIPVEKFISVFGFSKFTVVSKIENLKKGFDWTDFHHKFSHENPEGYNQFCSTYKF